MPSRLVSSPLIASKATLALNDGLCFVDPADYVPFLDKRAVGDIEATWEEEGQNLTMAEEQFGGYWILTSGRRKVSITITAPMTS